MKTRPLAAVLALLVAFATGCGGGSSDAASVGADDQDVIAGKGIAPGAFLLLDAPRIEPDPFCQRFVALRIEKGDRHASAHLENGVDGPCEIYVAPNERSYRLGNAQVDECGTSHYFASGVVAERPARLHLIDNRTRSCEDVIAGAIVVEETTTDESGEEHTSIHYSADNLPEVEPLDGGAAPGSAIDAGAPWIEE